MGFRIEYSLLAEADLEAILDWLIEQQAGEAGLRWFDELQEAVSTLSDMPRRCPLLKKDPRIKFEVRQLFYGKKPHVFRVLFRIIDDRVCIIRIRRGKQSFVPLH